jgi:hypothetical protein
MQLVLYRTFQLAGLPAPKMCIEIPVGADPDFARRVYDLFCSLLPRMEQHHLAYDDAGNLDTLQQRLEDEGSAAKAFGATIGLVGAWSIPLDGRGLKLEGSFRQVGLWASVTINRLKGETLLAVDSSATNQP